MSAPSAGMVRMNGSVLEAYDGNNWNGITKSVSISLDAEAVLLLEWAKEQRANNTRRMERIMNNPALQKAHERIKKAEEDFEILDQIINSEA